MKKVVQFILKAAACVWLGAAIPAMVYVSCLINAGEITRADALGMGAGYIGILVLLGLLLEKGDQK